MAGISRLKFHDAFSHLIPVTTTALPSFLMRRMVRRKMSAFYIKSIVMPDPLSYTRTIPNRLPVFRYDQFHSSLKCHQVFLDFTELFFGSFF